MNEEELQEQNPYGASYEQPVNTQLSVDESLAQSAAMEQEEADYQNNLDAEADALEDPRDSERWGVKGVLKELASIPSGGIQDTLSSGTTFAERTIDAVTGQRQKEIEEQGYYQPDFDPFTNGGQSEIITKTWWGKLARGVVHFGTMAGATVLAAKGAAAAGIGLGICLLYTSPSPRD